MKKRQTYSKVVIIEQDGLQVRAWEKTCIHCGKTYITTSRGQKFCSKECCIQATKKKSKQKKEYNATIEIQRLKARAHSLAVDLMEFYAKNDILIKECSECGELDNLQIHHKNLSWVDNSPSNLQWVCPKCHARIHSKLEEDIKLKGLSFESLYLQDFIPIIRILNKNVNEIN